MENTTNKLAAGFLNLLPPLLLLLLKDKDLMLVIIYRWLLWHGSRLTNWMGILGQGLRIAPPEAPVTGYMVSKIDLP